MTGSHWFLAAAIATIVPGMAVAADDPPAPPPPAAPGCSGPEHRQFDFWLGDWEVHGGPRGNKVVGHNRIARNSNGCWLVERWRSAAGTDGASLNAWDAHHRVWRQFWVGADGVVLRLEGGLQDGAMVMTGVLPAPAGGAQRQRISWTPRPGGSVIQRWETSDDDGGTWAVSFRGHYRRKVEMP